MPETTYDADWLSGEVYDAHRSADFAKFCTAAGTNLDAHVPTCPDWDVRGLCDHLARVYQGRGYVIEHAAFKDQDAFELRGDDEGAIEFVQRWSVALVAALSDRADDAPTVTFIPEARTVHFWRRRMALETLVHRTDAEIAVGTVSSMDDALSADGIDELLWFAPRTTSPSRERARRRDLVDVDGAPHRRDSRVARHAQRRGSVVGARRRPRGRDRARHGTGAAARALGAGPRGDRAVEVRGGSPGRRR